LKLISKDDEENLCTKEQKVEIILLFKFIYILLNKSYDNIQEDQIITYLLKTIMVEALNQDSISIYILLFYLENLFAKLLNNSVNLISIEQYDKLNTLVGNSPNMFEAKDLMKINRAVSYMAFYLKDIYDYLSLKGPDNRLIVYVKNIQLVKEKVSNQKATLLDLIEANENHYREVSKEEDNNNIQEEDNKEDKVPIETLIKPKEKIIEKSTFLDDIFQKEINTLKLSPTKINNSNCNSIKETESPIKEIVEVNENEPSAEKNSPNNFFKSRRRRNSNTEVIKSEELNELMKI